MKGDFRWTVRFKGASPKLGDALRFEFSITDLENGDVTFVIVRVARSLINDQRPGYQPQKAAAHAVKLHLEKRLSNDDYVNGEVAVTTYSDFHNDYIENYSEFSVSQPRKRIGLLPISF